MNMISTSIFPVGVAGVVPLSATDAVLATPATPVIDAPVAPSSTVELSGLAQFMAALSRAQKKLIEMQSSSTGSPQDPNPNFGTLNDTTQTVINAFNALQTAALGKAGQSSDAAAGAALAKQFAAALQQQAADNSAATDLGTLSQIGIGFPAAPAADAPAPLSVDAAALQTAFNANPAATLALVTQATDTLGTLGTGLAQQIGAAAAAAAAPPAPDVNAAAPSTSAAPVETAVPQSTLADMALSDLLAENLSQTQTAAPAAQPNPVPAPAIAVVTAAAQAAATETTQAEQATQATQATQAAAANQAANVATTPAPTPLAAPIATAPAAAPVVAENAPGDVQNIPDNVPGASVTPAGNGLPASAVATAVPVATEQIAAPLAQDPAVAAAIAAYHLNDSPFTAVTNGKQERASDVKTEAVPVVEALKRVLPIEKII